MTEIIILSLLIIIAIIAAVLIFLSDEKAFGFIAVGMAGLFAVALCGVIDRHTNGETYGPDSTIVKVMNNDPSIQIDTIALDKDGKIREIRIKELK